MTRAPLTEEPCVAKVTRTVLKTSGGGDPFAEPNRDLGMIKAQQKISGTFRRFAEAQRFARICSYISAARKQDQRVLEVLRSVFTGRPWMPVTEWVADML